MRFDHRQVVVFFSHVIWSNIKVLLSANDENRVLASSRITVVFLTPFFTLSLGLKPETPREICSSLSRKKYRIKLAVG